MDEAARQPVRTAAEAWPVDGISSCTYVFSLHIALMLSAAHHAMYLNKFAICV